MNKFFKSMLAIALATFAFTSCEDVPEPYAKPGTEPEPGLAEGTYLDASFGNGDGGFINANTLEGSQPWSIDSHGYAKGTGHISNDVPKVASQSYFISPEIDLTKAEKAYLQFDYLLRYVASDTENKVLLTANYTGDPATTQWTDITGTLTEVRDWTTWTTFAKDLPAELIGQDKVRVAFYFACSTSNASTWEVKNVTVKEGSAGQGGDNPEPQPTGELGTAEAPLTVAQALEIINGYEDKAESAEEAYVKGIVVSVDFYNTTYKSLTYYISDDGTATNQLQVYSGKGLNGAEFASKNDLKPGAIVVVKGKLKKFINKDNSVNPEINQGSTIISIENNEGGDNPTPDPQTGDATGDGSKANPFNAIAASQFASKLADKEVTTESYYIKGKIANIKYTFDAQHGTATFFISDNGQDANTFQIYSTYYLGNRAWVEGDKQIALGDEVIVYGKLTNYGGTPETSAKNSCLYSLNGEVVEIVDNGGEQGGEQGGETPSGDGLGTLAGNVLTLDCAGLNLGNNPSTVTLVDGTVLTLAKNDGNNNPAYNANYGELRLYARNSITINAGSKTISNVTFHCTANQGTPCVGNEGEVTASAGTLSVDTQAMTITVDGIAGSETTVTNGYAAKNSGGTQIRFNKLVITYAE